MNGICVGLRTDRPPDDQMWIAADARVDDRETLAAALDIQSTLELSDAELILQAFMKWGDRCVDHLHGDFAFAIWDGRARRLFCARDRIGVKPLYYVHAQGSLLLSSRVDSLRAHSVVSDALDDLAVADFLLFGHKTDPAATTFREIRRLPPAHTLVWSSEAGCRVRRYWEFPIDEPVYRKDTEYAEQLRELVDRAVADRLRGGRAGVFLSGGLDSAVIALTARRQASARDSIRAFCFLHESLTGDTERRYAAATAAHLDIPCQFHEAGATRWDQFDEPCTPEPLMAAIDPAVQARCLREAAAHSPVAFTGEGADNALFYEWESYVRHLWHAGRLCRLAADAVKFVRHHRRLPVPFALTRRRSPTMATESSPAIPPWISREIVDRLQLEDRWRSVMRPAVSAHPTRPAAYFSLHLPLWQDLFDSWDAAYTGVALEVRHPFLDVRLLRFLLSVPVIPWCRDKHLLRDAFGDQLPAVVRHRTKTPLGVAPDHARVRRDGLPPVTQSPQLEAYASPARVTRAAAENPRLAEGAVRLATFSRWLARLESSRV